MSDRVWPTEERIADVVRSIESLSEDIKDAGDVEGAHQQRDRILRDFLIDFAPEIVEASDTTERKVGFWYA